MIGNGDRVAVFLHQTDFGRMWLDGSENDLAAGTLFMGEDLARLHVRKPDTLVVVNGQSLHVGNLL